MVTVSKSVHPIDQCEKLERKQDLARSKTPQWSKVEIDVCSTDSTLVNQTVPVHTKGCLCGWAGKSFNRWIECAAIRMGKGPLAAEKKLRLLVYGPDDGEWSKTILAPGFGSPEDLERAAKQLRGLAFL